MVSVSHECPLELMNHFDKWNDYEYCLVHLLDEFPAYEYHFHAARTKGKRILLDNSIFELGEAFDWAEYVKWINKLLPNEYIVPDVLESSYDTITQFALWKDTCYDDAIVKSVIGVVQGKTYEELVECYEFMAENADKIAISFDYSYYLTIGESGNKWHTFMTGRQAFIDKLVADGIWRRDKPHHLLGAALPQEFKKYDWDALNIATLDTSNPIQQGLLGFEYTDDGLDEKRSLKVADSFTAYYPDSRIKIAEENVKKFKEFCKR